MDSFELRGGGGGGGGGLLREKKTRKQAVRFIEFTIFTFCL